MKKSFNNFLKRTFSSKTLTSYSECYGTKLVYPLGIDWPSSSYCNQLDFNTYSDANQRYKSLRKQKQNCEVNLSPLKSNSSICPNVFPRQDCSSNNIRKVKRKKNQRSMLRLTSITEEIDPDNSNSHEDNCSSTDEKFDYPTAINSSSDCVSNSFNDCAEATWLKINEKLHINMAFGEQRSPLIKMYASKLYSQFIYWQGNLLREIPFSPWCYSLVHSEDDNHRADYILRNLEEKGFQGKSIFDMTHGEDMFEFLENLQTNTNIVFIIITTSFQDTEGLHKFFTQEICHSFKKIIPIVASTDCRVIPYDDVLGGIVPLFMDDPMLFSNIIKLIDKNSNRSVPEVNDERSNISERIQEMEEKSINEIKIKIERLLSSSDTSGAIMQLIQEDELLAVR